MASQTGMAQEQGSTQISPGNHDSVRCFNDVLSIWYTVMALYLGHNLDDLVAARAQVALQIVDHVGSLNEGDGNEVHVHLDGKVNVEPVLQAVTWAVSIGKKLHAGHVVRAKP